MPSKPQSLPSAERPESSPDKRRTFEEVTDQIRDLVADGTLKPGDRLPSERDLATRLGVGRPALREALRTLESAGLLDLRKGKSGGAFVSHGKPDVVSDNFRDLLTLRHISIEELFEARLWIQGTLVRVACQRASDEDLEALDENVRQAERCHDEGRVEQRIAANIEFHNLLAAAAHNPVMILVLRALTDALRSLVREVGSEAPPTTFAVRRKLVDGLRRGDEEAAVRAMERIVREAEKMYSRLARRRKKSRKLVFSRTGTSASNEPAVATRAKSTARKKATSRPPSARGKKSTASRGGPR